MRNSIINKLFEKESRIIIHPKRTYFCHWLVNLTETTKPTNIHRQSLFLRPTEEYKSSYSESSSQRLKIKESTIPRLRYRYPCRSLLLLPVLYWHLICIYIPFSSLPVPTAAAFFPSPSSSTTARSSYTSFCMPQTMQVSSTRMCNKDQETSSPHFNGSRRRSPRVLNMIASSSLPDEEPTGKSSNTAAAATAASSTASPEKRPRGRPKKVPVPVSPDNSVAVASSDSDDEASPSSSRKRTRGVSSSSPPSPKGTPNKRKRSSSPVAKKKKAPNKKKNSPTKKKKIQLLKTTPPKDFESIYSIVEELREDRSAPVDHSGSEALPQKPPTVTVETYRYQVLIALMLSSQTKDGVVGETMATLQAHGLTVDKILSTTPDKLNEMIRKVGFHNNKTKYILETTKILKEQYHGDIPATPKEMMELPGIGPKMAYIIENVAWNECTGIGVDTHMHRLFNQLKWVNSKNPEQTRLQLEAWLPSRYWSTINYLWVGFGQEIQQFKPKILKKALNSSRPYDALKLFKRLGMDYRKEAEKAELTEELQEVLELEKKTKDEEIN